MIIGEEYWVQKALAEGEEYDYFLKKLRKKIKKIQPFKVLSPINPIKPVKKVIQTITGGGKASTPAAPPPKAGVATTVQEKVQLAEDRKVLMQEVADFETKKAEETIKMNEEKTVIEQEKLDAENGETKKMLYLGLAGLGGLVVIGGIVVWIKSRQNQLEALQLES